METDNSHTLRRWWLPLLSLILIVGAVAWGKALTQLGSANFDEPLLLWFRVSGDTGQLAGPVWALGVWQGLTFLGDTAPRIVVAGLTVLGLLLLHRHQSAFFLAVVLLSGVALSLILKHWVGRPRPQLVAQLDHASAPSFPSAHTFNSTLFYLMVALMLSGFLRHRGARWTAYAVAACLAVAVGVSRVALGVHYPTDVIAGWIIGAGWLGLWFAAAKYYWTKALP